MTHASQGVVWEASQASPRAVRLLHPDFSAHVNSMVQEADTGLQAVLLAMHRCHNVTVFGFTLNTSAVERGAM